MPLRLDIKRKLTARSDRVKSVDLHPTEPWMVVSLYSGTVVVWNHETQTMVKTFEVCDLPIRVARFVARKNWIIVGADDMLIRVFNYNTLERVHMFEAHIDYIRCVAVHPTQPYILTSSDDMLIKLWDWDRKWSCTQVFEGHTHYVMEIVINPKDNNQFASASLDRTIKVWQLGSKTPNFTLEGHNKGVNCIDYYGGGDKPYLISGADDHLIKIWDYQNKTCVQTLGGHTQNVTCVGFHPELPLILTGSEDGTVRVWHSNTYRLESTLNYSLERVWCISGQRGSNCVAIGYDEGSIIIKMGRDEPAMSMDSNGKVMWAHHSEMQQANLKAMGDAEFRDGEKLLLGVKHVGSCEIYPQTIQHSPNARFVVVCGDGEYIIYTAMALRNKSFGSALEFVWAHDSSQYAIREGNVTVKIFKNFKLKTTFKPDLGAEGIFGGFLLGVRSNSGLALYDWESNELIRRIEIQPKHIFWSDSGDLVCIATNESFFVLRYLPERVAAAQQSKEEMADDGIEGAFEVLGEVPEVVKTGVWVGDCFIYTSSLNRLNYYVGGEIITIAHLDRTMYLLGYIPKDDRLYLGDKELNIVSYSLLLSVLDYQTAVMRRDFSTADQVLLTIPKEQRIRVAYFLEKQGFRQQALAVSTDPEHKFDLALQLGEVKIAYQLASEAESEQKWKQLAELATAKCQYSLALECLHQAQDYGGLLMLATASGNANMVDKLADGAEKDGKNNIAFLTSFLQGRLDKCLDLLIKTNRLPEAAFLARTYLPSHVSRVVKLWKESLSKVNQKAADALADPSQYSNLFPGLQQALLAEQYLKKTRIGARPAADYPLIKPNEDRNVLEESAGFDPDGEISEPEEVTSMNKTVSPAAGSEAASAGREESEELVSLKPEMLVPVSTTEEASPLPVTATEEHAEPDEAESVSSEEDAITESEEVSVSGEENTPKSMTEMVQSSPMDDERLSNETDDFKSAALPAASESSPCETSETEEKPSEGVTPENTAAEDVLVSTGPTVDTSEAESLASVYEEQETPIASSEAPTIIGTTKEEEEEAQATEELVPGTEPLSVAVDELISFENTAGAVQDVPIHEQTFPDFAADPLLDLLGDTMPVLKPVAAQEPDQKEQTTARPVEPEDNLEPPESTQAEPLISSKVDAPTEEQDAGPEGAEEPAEDMEAELNEEGLDDLDLDNFELEDIDTTDVNLDEDFLNEL